MSVSRLVLLLFASLALMAWSVDQEPQSLPTSCLIVESNNGRHQFTVEVADDREERNMGMMYRTEMADDTGMLFTYSRAQGLSFWMRNTYLPLDIIYVRTSGRILNIVENAEPLTDTPRRSTGRAIAVLEIRGGLASELGIGPGDLIRHDFFNNSDC